MTLYKIILSILVTITLYFIAKVFELSLWVVGLAYMVGFLYFILLDYYERD